VGLRDHLKRIHRAARERLDSFELLDGSTYYYDRLATYAAMFLHQFDVEVGRGEDWPEPPEIYRKVCEAKDPAAVLARFIPQNLDVAAVNPAALYDLGILVGERRLVPVRHFGTSVEDFSES
jgi:hypothetical protein